MKTVDFQVPVPTDPDRVTLAVCVVRPDGNPRWVTVDCERSAVTTLPHADLDYRYLAPAFASIRQGL